MNFLYKSVATSEGLEDLMEFLPSSPLSLYFFLGQEGTFAPFGTVARC